MSPFLVLPSENPSEAPSPTALPLRALSAAAAFQCAQDYPLPPHQIFKHNTSIEDKNQDIKIQYNNLINP